MESKIVSGKFLASTAEVNVECGFVPDYIEAFSALGGTEIKYEWFKVLYDTAAAALGKYGFVTDGAPAHVAAATNGFRPYDTSVESVVLPAPDGDGYMKAASIADYNIATTYTARSVTALGSVVRPSTHNGFVYELITASGGAAGAEPTWPTKVGDTVTATSTDVWICREERVVRTGVKGFTVGATICTDGEYWVFKAEQHDRYSYMGDADVENPVTFGDHMR
jgi:hypothetical protein